MLEKITQDSANFNELYIVKVITFLTAVILSVRSVEHYYYARYVEITLNAIFFLALLYTDRLLKIQRLLEAKHFFVLSYATCTSIFFYLRGVDMVPCVLSIR